LETQSQVLDALSGSSMPSSICWIVLACPLRMMKTRKHPLLRIENSKDLQPSGPWLPPNSVDFGTRFEWTSGLLAGENAASNSKETQCLCLT
jgi:hypothetical protein